MSQGWDNSLGWHVERQPFKTCSGVWLHRWALDAKASTWQTCLASPLPGAPTCPLLPSWALSIGMFSSLCKASSLLSSLCRKVASSPRLPLTPWLKDPPHPHSSHTAWLYSPSLSACCVPSCPELYFPVTGFSSTVSPTWMWALY